MCLSSNEEESKKAFDALKNSEVPKKLKVKGFIIGSSVSGVAGTYVVNEKIEI